MEKTRNITMDVMVAEEKKVRAALIHRADHFEYQLDGLFDRWCTILRLINLLHNGQVEVMWVYQELSRLDMETLKQVFKALP